jgi:hypothetical protein
VVAPILAAIAVTLAAYKLGEWVSDVTGLADAFNRAANEGRAVDEVFDRSSESLAKLANSGALAKSDMESFNAAVSAGKLIFDQATGSWIEADLTMGRLSDGTEGAVDAHGRLYRAVTDGSGAVIQYERVIGGANLAIATFSGESAKSSKEAAEMERTLETLASNEKIKMMEFAMKLDIAEIEANTEIAKAAFESMNVTIQSTGDLLGNLFGLLTDDNLTAWDKAKIWEQIEQENEMRLKTMELQQQMLEAYIEQIELRNEQMKNDNAMITIDGSGLAPHLEAFMWEILSAIQTRVNSEGLELLLGFD